MTPTSSPGSEPAAAAPAAASIEIARPTVQYTTGAPHVVVQFQRRSKRTGHWLAPETFHPTQAALAAHAPAGSGAGYWADAEVERELLVYLATEYGITNAVIVDDAAAAPAPAPAPAPAQAAGDAAAAEPAP
ncbi:MAG TPA: hypothetical protein VHB25_08605 [Gemmatimonadaceae bacterium]|nr:hypothetical protein [Gemmatimonadaceae bacterium]